MEHFSSVKVAQVRGFSSGLAPAPKSQWAVVRDLLNTIILLGGASYSIRYLYKYFYLSSKYSLLLIIITISILGGLLLHSYSIAKKKNHYLKRWKR